MLKILITENTYSFLINNAWSAMLLKCSGITCQKKETEYVMSFVLDSNNVNDIYKLISFVYMNKPEENNRWIFNEKEYLITDELPIRYFLHNFEGTDAYPLKRIILSDLIKDNKLNNVQQVRDLAQKPFTGILKFNNFDILKFLGIMSEEEIPQCIKIEHQDMRVSNRYIPNSLEVNKGKVYLRNCIIDGDIVISGSESIDISQCIITGKVTCIDASYVYLSSVNVKQFFLYNSNLDFLRFEYTKIYRFIFHSCSVKKFELDHNKFVEPYIAYLHLPDKKNKMDMSQFVVKNINEQTIKKINKDKPIIIKNEHEFFLTFQFREPISPISPEDIALDMVDIVLTHGDLNKNHYLHSDMKYKKVLYSNTGYKRFFVRLTGAFYIPSRWIIYLVLSTVLFTSLYIGIPTFKFTTIPASTIERLNLWTALYYSICQIIGSNLTNYTPTGVTQICTTIQSLLNTVFIANFFASLIKKYMRD